MKNSIFILVLTLLTSFNFYAQTIELTIPKPEKYPDSLNQEIYNQFLLHPELSGFVNTPILHNTNSRDLKEVLDSTTVHLLNTSGQLYTFDKDEYTYDIHGNVTKHITFDYGLIYESKEENEYDFYGNRTLGSKYYWNTSSQTWVGNSKLTFKYDGTGNLIKQTLYYWDNSVGDWYTFRKVEFKYDPNNLKINESAHTITTTGWLKTIDIDYQYSQSQKLTKRVAKWWDSSIQQWDKLDKFELSYNTNDSLISEKFSTKQGSDSWLARTKNIYQYDLNGNMTYRARYFLNSTTYQLEKVASTEYIFDFNNNLIEQKEIVWEGATTAPWKFANTKSYTYNSNNELIERLHTYWSVANSNWYVASKVVAAYDANGYSTYTASLSWDTLTNQWDSTSKNFRAFDINGNMLQQEYYYWKGSINDWYGTLKHESSFDANSLNTSLTNYTWSYTTNFWTENYRDSMSYDNSFNMIFKKHRTWNVNSTSWETKYKLELSHDNNFLRQDLFAPINYSYNTKFLSEQYFAFNNITSSWDTGGVIIYHYSAQNINSISEISKNNLTVYPNPFTDFITFKNTDITGKMSLHIYDIQGRKVLSSTVTNNQKVSTEKLSNGIYIYSLEANGEAWKGKLIKQ